MVKSLTTLLKENTSQNPIDFFDLKDFPLMLYLSNQTKLLKDFLNIFKYSIEDLVFTAVE